MSKNNPIQYITARYARRYRELFKYEPWSILIERSHITRMYDFPTRASIARFGRVMPLLDPQEADDENLEA